MASTPSKKPSRTIGLAVLAPSGGPGGPSPKPRPPSPPMGKTAAGGAMYAREFMRALQTGDPNQVYDAFKAMKDACEADQSDNDGDEGY